MRLIDADRLLTDRMKEHYYHLPNGDIAIPIIDIEHAPTIEPKKGRWIEYDNSHCECPFCHEEWSYFDNEVEHFNYCPNCGAKMEEGGDK